jgi:glycosyltransferase involved in cell wall biosynthesis
VKVLQLVQKPQPRGAEVFAFHLSAWLRSRSHEVQTVYLYPYSGDGRLEIIPGDVVAMGRERSAFERVAGIHPRLLGRVRRVISAFAPDIVQTNGARTLKYGAALTRVDRGRQWRLIYRNIDSPTFWVRGRLREAYYRRGVVPRVDGVVSVSEATHEEVRAFYQLQVPSVFVPNGVDLNGLTARESRESVRTRYDTPLSATVLLFIGSIGPQKRADRFLRVLASIAPTRGEVYGWLLGDGPDLEKSRRLAAELGIADRVRFLGSRTGVACIAAACDIHVSSSDTEGMPAVVIETGHLGLPTAAFRIGGVHECVREGETGVLAPPGDETALTRAVLTLVASPSLRKTMGEAARHWVNSRFSIEDVGPQYESFYSRVLGRAG